MNKPIPTLQTMQFKTRQDGGTLAIALIFLVLLSMIGITGMQVTAMEERMAGNARDRNVAFQAAEASLRHAAEVLSGKTPESFDVNCTGGLCLQGSAPDWQTYAWDGTKDVKAAIKIAGLAEEPRYFSEYLPNSAKTSEEAGGGRPVYRVTARARGNNADTVVFLQQVILIP